MNRQVLRNLACTAYVLLACTGEDPPSEPTPAQFVRAVVDSAGGEVVLEGRAKLVIPPNALAEEVEITIAARDVPEDLEGAVTVLYTFEPDRLQFAEPARLTLQVPAGVDPTDPDLAVLKHITSTDEDGTNNRVAKRQPESTYDDERRQASARIAGFSDYYIARATPATRLDEPTIDRAEWDACSRRTTLEWSGVGGFEAVYVERWSRQGGSGALPSVCVGRGAMDPNLCNGFSLDFGRVQSTVLPSSVVWRGEVAPAPNALAYEYAFRLYAGSIGLGGTLQISNQVEEAYVAAPEVLPPEAPENLMVSASSPTRIQVAWSPSANPDDLWNVAEVFRVPAWTSIANPQVYVATAFFDETDVTPNVNYTYSVRHVNTQSCPTPLIGPAVSASLRAPQAPPGPIASLTATADSGALVIVDWSDVPTATEYRVERRTAGGPFVSQATLAIPSTEYRDNMVDPATSYTYRVTPSNAAGDGPSAEVAVTTPMTTVGPSVTNECGDTRITVSPRMRSVALGAAPGADYIVTVEWLNGSTDTLTLSLASPDLLPFEAAALLENATRLDGQTPVVGRGYYLFDQPPTQSGTLVVEPSSVFFGPLADVAVPRPLPHTYDLELSATGCPVTVQLEVTP